MSRRGEKDRQGLGYDHCSLPVASPQEVPDASAFARERTQRLSFIGDIQLRQPGCNLKKNTPIARDKKGLLYSTQITSPHFPFQIAFKVDPDPCRHSNAHLGNCPLICSYIVNSSDALNTFMLVLFNLKSLENVLYPSH